jgi:tetratricopeptide (TPR) repeat protein
MGAVTYPNAEVGEFVSKNLIPLQVKSDAQPLANDFNVKWTPTLITLDAEGKEHHRTVGFLPPEELIPSLLLGIAKCQFDRDRFAEALASLDKLLAEYSKSDSAPEAIFLRGVSRYKSTHDPKPLKEAYEKLQSEYPSSEWTKRAYPYRLIP